MKARQVLGTVEELSIQDRTSPGLRGNVQFLREVESLRDRLSRGQQSRQGRVGSKSFREINQENGS